MNCACRLAMLVFAMLIVGVAGQDSRAQNSGDRVTVINLEKFGWQPLPHASDVELREPRAQVLAIDHHGRVLVGYTAREHEGLARREAPSLSLHILRLTPDGTLDSTISVSTSRWFGNGFYLDGQDRIFAKTNDSLRILAGDEEPNGLSQSGRPIAACSAKCTILQSASHNTLQLRDIPGFGQGLMYINTTSSPPRVIQRCDQVSPYYPNTITDTFAYFARQESVRDAFLNRWPFCNYKNVTDTSIVAGGAIHALNDDSLVLVHPSVVGHSAVEIISKDGERKFLWEMVKNDMPFNEVSSTESGQRFAIQIVSYRGGSARLDIGGHVVARRIAIYDARSGQQISSFAVGQTHPSSLSFYLSPDGHELAVLEDTTVTVRKVQ